MSVFGAIIDGGTVEDWVRDHLRLWFDTYAIEFELQNALAPETLPRPRSWIITEEVDREAEDQFPTVLVISPGLAGDPPKQEGDGSYRATWAIGVGVFVSAATRDDTRLLCRQYVAILRALMIQKQGLGMTAGGEHRADGTRWMDESYDDNYNWMDRKTISAGQVVFEVDVCGVTNRQGGPLAPPDSIAQPGSEWLTVDTVVTDIQKVSTLPEEG